MRQPPIYQPPPYRPERPTRWELVQTGFWIALGFMAAWLVVSVVGTLAVIAFSIALRQMAET